MATELAAYVAELRAPPPLPSFEPEIDDLDAEEDRKLRELDALSAGAVQKGITQPGHGDATPQQGDLVYLHISVKKEGGQVLQSTRTDEGGSGVPLVFVLGKGKRAPRGWELAFQDMRQGERAMLRIRADYSFAQPGTSLRPPRGMPADAALLLDAQLLTWYDKDSVRVVGKGEDTFKCSVELPDSWETPRAPFEVTISVAARVPSSDGVQGTGKPFYQTPSDSPLSFAVGDGSVPADLEDAVCSLTKGERAFFSCPVGAKEQGGAAMPASSQHPALQPPQGCARVEYEVVLLSMLQVRDLVGDGAVTKRRVREGRGEFPVDCPLDDNAVQIHFTAAVAGTGQVIFDTRGPDGQQPPVRFDTGMDAVCPALDMAVRLMTPGELSLVRSTDRYAYAGRPERPQGLPEGADVEFQVELVDFERQATWAAMSGGDKLARATVLKEQGNRVFKLGPSHFDFAKQKWAKAIKMVDQAFDLEEQEEVDTAGSLKVGCQLNLALLAQRQGKYTECFGWCEKALREGDHPKALYRRGTTHALLGNYAEARSDLQLVAQLDPSTKAEVDRQLAALLASERAAKDKQKREFRDFFNR